MPASELSEALGADPPAPVADLPADVQSRLAAQVRAARARQRQVSETSVREAIDGVPLAVRGIVRKALLG